MIKKIKFNLSWIVKIKKIPWLLGEYAFLTILFFIFITLIFGGFIFYKYSFLVERKTPEVSKMVFQFEEKIYQEILKTWQEREKKFREADEKEYLNLFQKERPLKIEENEEKPAETPENFIYIVKKGETLWQLSERFLGSGQRWREIKSEATGEIFTENAAEFLPIGIKLIIPTK